MRRAIALAATVALLAAGCTDGSGTVDQPAPTMTPTSTASVTETAGPTTFAPAELEDLYDVVSDIVEGERGRGADRDFYATTRPRAAEVVKLVAAALPDALPTHAVGAAVLVGYAVAPYDDRALLRCAAGPEELRLVIVTDEQGQTITTITATDESAAFLIYDYAQRGKQTFDENGFATGSGTCESTGDVEMLATSRVRL